MGRRKTRQPARTRTGCKGEQVGRHTETDGPPSPPPCGEAARWHTRRPSRTGLPEMHLMPGTRRVRRADRAYAPLCYAGRSETVCRPIPIITLGGGTFAQLSPWHILSGTGYVNNAERRWHQECGQNATRDRVELRTSMPLLAIYNLVAIFEVLEPIDTDTGRRASGQAASNCE